MSKADSTLQYLPNDDQIMVCVSLNLHCLYIKNIHSTVNLY